MSLAVASDAPSFKIREHLIPLDRSRIFELLSTGGYFYPHEMAYGMTLFDEYLLKGENGPYQFMLYEEGDRILACGCFGALPLTDRRYHLHWLAVAHDLQGKGVGQRLEAAVIARVRLQGGTRIYAETSNRPYHARAREFYEKCGYRKAAVIPEYYGDHDDKLLYLKNL